jgi:hypothetical protein
MDTIDQQIGYNKVISDNQFFSNLLGNPDFEKWRNEVVLKRLETMKNAILTVDRTQEGWKERVCDAIVAYQEANVMYVSLFTLVEETIKTAREQLNRLSDQQT